MSWNYLQLYQSKFQDNCLVDTSKFKYWFPNCSRLLKFQIWWAGIITSYIKYSVGDGGSGDIAGLKWRDLTSDKSWHCRTCARVLISRQNALHTKVRADINLKFWFSNNLAHTVNTLPLNLAVSSKPGFLPWKRYRLIFATESRLFQKNKNWPRGEKLLAGILPQICLRSIGRLAGL